MLQLRHERVRRGWNQTQLAARAGLHTQQISAFENEVLRPYPSQLARLARALDIPVDEADRLLDRVEGVNRDG